MADLNALTYCRLVGFYNSVVADTVGPYGDTDERPDMFKPYMDATITVFVAGQEGRTPELRLEDATPPRTVLLTPIDCVVEAGVFRLKSQNTGIDGVDIIAKSAVLGLGDTPLLCRVDFGPVRIAGRTHQYQPVTFVLPTVERDEYTAGVHQVVTITGSPTGGLFRLLYENSATSTLARSSTAAAVQAALRALPAIGDNVTVTGPAGGPYDVVFTGALAADTPSPLRASDSLTGGNSPEVTVEDLYQPVTLDLSTVDRVDLPPSTPSQLVVRMIPDQLVLEDDGPPSLIRFYASGEPIGDPIPVTVDLSADNITDSTATGRSLLRAANQNSALSALGASATGRAVVTGDAAAGRKALQLGVFDARDYGVIADGAEHNNVANLLDCFAACAAAGGGTVVLPAGVIVTSEADAWVTVTADSGNTYTNKGGIPLPVDTPITVRGHGTGATVLKLSTGFPRAFDFPQPVLNAPVDFRDITLRDFTVDQDNLTGLDLGPLTTLGSGVSLPTGWTTLPGVSPAAFTNCRLVWFPETNTGTASRIVMAARVNGGSFQVRNDTVTTHTLMTGDNFQGSWRNHVLLGNYIDAGSVASGRNTRITGLRVENVDVVNVSTSVSTTGLAAPNSPDQFGAVRLWSRFDGLTSAELTPAITDCEFRNMRMEGGNVGIEVNGSAGTWINDVWMYDCFHDTKVVGQGNWPSANFMIGQYAWVGRVGLVRCHGKGSGDVALELDQPWEAYEIDCVWEDSFNGVYSTSFVPPAQTSTGPRTSALVGAMNSSVTAATFALPNEVAKAGLARIDSELIWYSTASGWPAAPGADPSLTIVRGFNGTFADSHADGATVTFVESDKTRIHSVRSTIRNSAASMTGNLGSTPGYCSYENANLPLPPITVRDSLIESAGGDYKVGQFIDWTGWRPDYDIQGLRIIHDGLQNPQATSADNRAYGSAISWRWDWGSTFNYSTVPSFRYPRVYGRDVAVRVNTTSKTYESYTVLAPQRGLALLDIDIDIDVVGQWQSPNSGQLVNLYPPNNWVVQLCPGSRLGITAAAGHAGGDAVPCALRVAPSTHLKIGGVLDVDLDLTRLKHGGGTGDGNYLPWMIDATNVGKVRFGRIRHSLSNTGRYPSRKQLVAMTASNYTVAADDDIVQVDTTAGPVTITLPLSTGGSAAVGEPLTRGRVLLIVDVGRNAGTNAITVTPASTDKINGGTAGAAVTINSNGGSLELLSTPSMPGWTRLNGDPREVAAAYYDSLTTTMSSKTLTTPKIEYVRAANDTNALYLQSVTNAVNYVQITPQVSTQPPIVRAAGSDANVGLQLRPKGNGNVGIVDGAGYGIAAFNFWGAASANGNYWIFSAGASGSNALVLSAAGGDTNVSINVLPKGSGALQVNGVPVSTNSTTSTHTAQQIELGHATDTTITRAAAGMVAVEGNPLGVKVAVPASATATGAVGQWAADSSWIYVCTGANTWARAALATW